MYYQKLVDGHEKFKNRTFENFKQDFKVLARDGQKPKVLFIGCSDSRVSPDLIVDSHPGDMFVARNIGNFVPPYKQNDDFHGTTAVIEYAIVVLKVADIIVCGHSHCGACEALFDDNIKSNKHLTNVSKWLELGYEAKQNAMKICQNDKSKLLQTTEKESVKLQLRNLLTYPMIQKLTTEKKLNIHGWYYDIQNGEIYNYDKQKNNFKEKI
jgi:carbonic anhydrase